MENLQNFIIKIKYNRDFLNHTRSQSSSSHLVTIDELRMRKIIIQNYTKSFIICNIFGLYLNYIRKNKSAAKTIMSNIG